jgi:polyhydroxybutyrate depolymerase
MRLFSTYLPAVAVFSALIGCSPAEPGDSPSTGGAGTAGAPSGGMAGAVSSGGQAGTTSAAGAAGAPATAGGGAGGSGGAPGTGGASGGGAGGAGGIMKSTGCGKPAPGEFTPEMYVRKSLPDIAKTNQGAERVYELRLPKDYDMNRPYPIVFESHGCDGSIPFHIEDVTKTDALVVALRAGDNQDNDYNGGCFATGPNDDRLVEASYFDAVVTAIEMNLCVDKDKLFMEGYSSGSWLTNLLGCVRAKTLRGQGNATGGLPKVPAVCEGPMAAMLVHDEGDTMNTIEEGIKARDRLKAINGCSDTTLPYQWDVNPDTPSVCVQYQGCMPGYPLIWCQTQGKGHSDGKPMTTVGLWKFWSSLPPRQ